MGRQISFVSLVLITLLAGCERGRRPVVQHLEVAGNPTCEPTCFVR